MAENYKFKDVKGVQLIIYLKRCNLFKFILSCLFVVSTQQLENLGFVNTVPRFLAFEYSLMIVR